MKRFLLVVFAISMVVSLPAQKAQACSCMATTPEQIIADSDAVFRGTVTAKTEGSLAENDVVTFEVESVVKGNVSNTTTIMTPADSAGCGVEYVIGQEYAVAVTEVDGDKMSFLCSSLALQDLNETGSDCAPYVCRDGTVHPACTEDGQVINYFAEPCLTHGGEVGGPVSSFTDVRANHPNYQAISWARTSGIVEGYADGTFRPNAQVNRAEFVKILIEAYNIGTDALCRMAAFSDAPLSEWYGPYVHAARCRAIIGGYPDGTFRPSANINFAEAAKIVANLHAGESMEPGNPWYQVYVDYLEAREAVPTSIRSNSQLVTRGEMVDMMYRLQIGEEAVFCTMDAMECPDGSFVGRVPPTCEFAACPAEPVACTREAKLCPDGSYVGREGPNCEFAPCPGETDLPELAAQSSWTGRLERMQRPEADIAYDYKIVFDRAYRDSLNAIDPEMQIWESPVFINSNSGLDTSDLETFIGADVRIWGDVEWGYAESRVIILSNIQAQ